MTTEPNAGNPLGVDPLRAAAQAPEAAQPSKSTEGPAFHVLLERLQAQASELEETSRTLEDPKSLAGAVDIARTSLNDALSLSDRLLEAFREHQHQNLPEDKE